MRASALTRISHYGFKRFEIGMNVTENCKPHYGPPLSTEKAEPYNGSTRAHERFGA
jgi:hypothetical protein